MNKAAEKCVWGAVFLYGCYGLWIVTEACKSIQHSIKSSEESREYIRQVKQQLERIGKK
jgi:hypothetical protein